MKAWGVYDDELREIANDVGLRIRGAGPKREGRAYRFRLALREKLPPAYYVHRGHYRFQKLDQWRLGTGHVCWHGQRLFLHSLFRQFPEAVVDTAFQRYYGLEGFERMYLETKNASIRGYVDNAGQCTCPVGLREERRLWRPPITDEAHEQAIETVASIDLSSLIRQFNQTSDAARDAVRETSTAFTTAASTASTWRFVLPSDRETERGT